MRSLYWLLNIILAIFIGLACGDGSSPDKSGEDPNTTKSVAPTTKSPFRLREIDTTKEASEYTVDELVDYINHPNFFKKTTFKRGDLIYRCVEPTEKNPPSFPAYFAVSSQFGGFDILQLTGGLCLNKNVYSYRVTKDFSVIDLRANENLFKYPNSDFLPTNFEALRVLEKFYGRQIHDAGYRAHILDATFLRYVDLELQPNALQAQKVAKAQAVVTQWKNTVNQNIDPHTHFLCHWVIAAPYYKQHNIDNDTNGIADYDLGIDADGQTLPTFPNIRDKKNISERFHELIICNPDAYLEFNRLEIKNPLL